MEQLEPSEEQILKLGKKLMEELAQIGSTDTVSKWMVYYLSEMMVRTEEADTVEEKAILKKECFEIIMKLWSRKDNLPIRNPFDYIKPIQEIFSALTEDRNVTILPRWMEYSPLPRESEWASFVDLVKNNSEKIFAKVVDINLHKAILLKDVAWLQENKVFLSPDEIYYLEQIELLKELSNFAGVFDLTDFEPSAGGKEKVDLVFNELENLIDAQKKVLKKLKTNYLKNAGR